MPDNLLPVVTELPVCCGTEPIPPQTGTKFHFALNVCNLERSVAFYRVLFDLPPAKHYGDYAKFELEQPPLVFSLVPNSPASAGALSHFGFPVSSTEEVNAAACRLNAAGLTTTCQEGTVCGYARQDKVWVADPDHNHWEIYVVHEDVDPETVRSGYDGLPPVVRQAPTAEPAAPAPVRVIWDHRVMQPVPEFIPHEDASVDEVRLEGLFNSPATAVQRRHLLAEVRRVVRPDGLVLVHGLVSDHPLPGALPMLPGVAALVHQVPVESAPLEELKAAGFENIRVTKLPEKPVFQAGPVEMREIKIEAMALAVAPDSITRMVIYKGPFAQATDEAGQLFLRGQRTEVSAATWNRLSRSAAAKQFLFLGCESADDVTCGM